MAANVNASGFGHAILHPAPALAGFAAKFKLGFAAFMKNLQQARMISALNTLSETQLAEIGIKRSEIEAYAATLMAND